MKHDVNLHLDLMPMPMNLADVLGTYPPLRTVCVMLTLTELSQR